MFRRIVVFIASLLLLLNSALVNASIGGWTLSNPTAVGASILYDGTKGSLTSSVLISPNASQVAKVLRGGIAGIALSYAVKQLLGAVDWILDPANNQILYRDPKAPNPRNIPKVWCYDPGSGKLCFSSPIAAKDYFKAKYSQFPAEYIWKQYSDTHWYLVLREKKDSTSGGVSVSFLYINNPYYNPTLEDRKTLALEIVAQQVIENAESDNLDAQFTVLAAATNILSEAEQDDAKAKPIANELDNNSKCPSGIVRNGSCWVCDKSLFMPYTRATRDAKNATRGKSCKNVTDTTVKAANATLFRNLINARVQENACWSPPDPNHAIALTDAQNALSLCEN